MLNPLPSHSRRQRTAPPRGPPKGGASRRKREEGREWDRGADCHFNNKAQHCDPARLERERGRKEAEAARVACVLAYLPAPFHAPCGAPTAVSPHHAKSSTAGLGRRIPNYKYSGFEEGRQRFPRLTVGPYWPHGPITQLSSSLTRNRCRIEIGRASWSPTMWGNLWQNLVEHSEIQVGPPSLIFN